MLAPPRPPSTTELELLIREARARQRRRWVGLAALLALVSGVAFGIQAIVSGSHRTGAVAGEGALIVRSGQSCGVRAAWTHILDGSGRTLYTEPGSWTHPQGHRVLCSGSSIWVVWDNGAAMNQEGYVGVHSGDDGHTWRLVFAERYFGVNAPHELDSYLGPWTLRSPRVAYFTGWCPACSPRPTVALWVTRDAGRSFVEYPVAALAGYEPTSLRVAGKRLTISGVAMMRREPPRRTATIRVP